MSQYSQLRFFRLCLVGLILQVATSTYASEIHKAIEKNNLQLLQRLAGSKATINKKDVFGYTPLIFACALKKPKIAKWLIHHGAKINSKTVRLKTALMYAADHGDVELIELLVKQGAKIDTQDKMGYTALFYAVERGHDKAISSLMVLGADPSIKAKKGRNVVMIWAGHPSASVAILEKFHKKGADLTAFDTESNFSALSVNTMFRGNFNVFKYLVDNKADVNWVDMHGRTPLIYAVLNRQVKKIAYLIEKGAKVNKSRYKGLTPLMLASQQGNYLVAEMLVSSGAKTELRDKKGRTALDHAKERGHKTIVTYLDKF